LPIAQSARAVSLTLACRERRWVNDGARVPEAAGNLQTGRLSAPALGDF